MKIGDKVKYVMDGKYYEIIATVTTPYVTPFGEKIYPIEGRDFVLAVLAPFKSPEFDPFVHVQKELLEPLEY